uniref:Phosphatidylinositol 3-kinase catalytic subunit type 3 n=1 Tax=Molossus molossus TaxID=27622 RepID=A0A7J8HK89_MOLMO|nr:phosphatidylinositol 3-kinase catalytic subunit type 3 [Molossus molossus]
MVDANIPDIALEPDKTVKKVQDKFRLDLSDEEAVHYMQSLIDESVHALFAAVVEQIHKFAQVSSLRPARLSQLLHGHSRVLRAHSSRAS